MYACCTLRFARPFREDSLAGAARFLVLYRELTGAKAYRRRVPGPPDRTGARWEASRIPDDPAAIQRNWPPTGVELRLPVYPPLDRLTLDPEGIRMEAGSVSAAEEILPTFAALSRLSERATGMEPRVIYGARMHLHGDFTGVLTRVLDALAEFGDRSAGLPVDGPPPPIGGLRLRMTTIVSGGEDAPAILPGRTHEIDLPGDPRVPEDARRDRTIDAVRRIEEGNVVISSVDAETEGGRLALSALPRDPAVAATVRRNPVRYPLELAVDDAERYRRLLLLLRDCPITRRSASRS